MGRATAAHHNVSRRRSLPLVLMIGSGLGLLAVGVSGLWRAAQAARVQVAVWAAQESQRVATGMQRALQAPALLDRASSAQRFALRSGQVVVPREVGWVDRPPRAMESEVRDPLSVPARLARLGPRPAAEQLDAVRAALAATAEQHDVHLPALVACAWVALRLGEDKWQWELVASAERILGSETVREAVADDAVLSLALLAVRHGGEAHAASDAATHQRVARALGRCDPAVADAYMLRVTESTKAPIDTSAWRTHVADIAARRAILARARAATAQLGAARAPFHLMHDDVLLAFFPTAPGDGEGCVLPARPTLDAVLAAQAPGEGIALALGDMPPSDAVGVLPGVAVRARDAVAPSSPWPLLSLVGALGLLFAGTLFATVRGMRQQAEAQQARAEFLTSVTHELKTPLSSLRLLSELLATGRVATPAQRQEYYELLASETARLCALVENVLDLGRTERGERGLDLQLFDVNELVGETAALLRTVLERDGVALLVTLASEPVPVRADRGAVTQALLNLLDNARKYGSTAHGLAVRVEPGRESAAIVVRDHGPGIVEAERERIFAKFARGQQHTDGQVPGLGLGLYLARALARAHGGEVTCRTPLDGGAGAEFVLALPRAAESSG
jgi:signal transduction histidine kinase